MVRVADDTSASDQLARMPTGTCTDSVWSTSGLSRPGPGQSASGGIKSKPARDLAPTLGLRASSRGPPADWIPETQLPVSVRVRAGQDRGARLRRGSRHRDAEEKPGRLRRTTATPMPHRTFQPAIHQEPASASQTTTRSSSPRSCPRRGPWTPLGRTSCSLLAGLRRSAVLHPRGGCKRWTTSWRGGSPWAPKAHPRSSRRRRGVSGTSPKPMSWLGTQPRGTARLRKQSCETRARLRTAQTHHGKA